MFYFNHEEIESIISSSDKNSLPSYVTSVFTQARKQYKPLFFTPYRSLYECTGELIAPVIDPIRLSGIGGASVFASVVAAVAALGSLLVAGVAALCLRSSLRDAAWDLSCQMISVVGIGLITAASSLFLALASIPHGLVSVVTRSAATIDSLMTDKEDLEYGNEPSSMTHAPN